MGNYDMWSISGVKCILKTDLHLLFDDDGTARYLNHKKGWITCYNGDTLWDAIPVTLCPI